MKKSFFALMLAAVLPTANAASVAELEERIEVFITLFYYDNKSC